MSIYQDNPNIEIVKVRAKVVFGDIPVSGSTGSSSFYSLAETPYILSFNVTKQRGRPSQCSVSMKIKAEDLDQITDYIILKAGSEGSMITIFSGKVKQIVPSPSWDDPTYLVVNITARDVLSNLEDKKITRRQTQSKHSWVSIDSVISRAPKDQRLKFLRSNEPTIISVTGSLEDSDGLGQIAASEKSATNETVTAQVESKGPGKAAPIIAYTEEIVV